MIAPNSYVSAVEPSQLTGQTFEEEETQRNEQQGKSELTIVVKEDIVREDGLPFITILFGFFKGSLNSSILLFPWAFKNALPLYAFIMLFCIALLSYLTMSRLVKCTQYHYTRLHIPKLSYGNVAKYSCRVSFHWIQNYGRLAKNIVNGVTLVHQFSVCSLYCLFIATTMERFIGIDKSAAASWLLLIFIPVAVLNAVMTVRILAIMVFIASGMIIISLALLVFVLIEKVLTGDSDTIALKDIRFDLNAEGLFVTCGTIMVSCLAQSLVLPLENRIKKPRKMLGPCGVLSLGISLSSVIYACVGFFGYLAYGRGLQDTILNCLKMNTLLSTIIWLFFCLSIFTSLMLQMSVIVGVLWPKIKLWIKDFTPRMKITCRLIFRTFLVCIFCSIAFHVQDPRIIIPFIGVTTGNLLAFVFPAIIDLLTFVPLFLDHCRVREAYVRLGQDLLLVCFGVVMMIGGVTENILAIIDGVDSMKGCNATPVE